MKKTQKKNTRKNTKVKPIDSKANSRKMCDVEKKSSTSRQVESVNKKTVQVKTTEVKSSDSTEKPVRRGPGRPKGSVKYTEPMRSVRAPLSLVDKVKDFIARNGYKFRLYSDQIQAGFPSPAEDAPFETIDLAQYLAPNPTATFFIRVTGESMRDAGIFPGDILIVDRSLEARNGDVVVAALDGEFTVKRLFKTKNRVELRPENRKFPILQIDGESELIVWGVVRRVIHNV